MNDISIYGKTKLANVLVSNELARRLNGTGVTVNCLHPGVVQTDILRNLPYGFSKIGHFIYGFF
ncbi:Retinol dehydrogenase 14, partial [Gryllus bimaculatus]